MNTKILGDQGEECAAAYLTARHYHILARKFRAPTGEIDLIAKRQGIVVFIEVKTRRNSRYGAPAAAVDHRKQQKIIHTAYWYLQANHLNLDDTACRFDVIEVYAAANHQWTVQQFENAFEVSQ